MADTPKKPVLQNAHCFICCEKQRYYKLYSKMKNVEKIDRISFLLKTDFKVVVDANNLGICRSCDVKISNAFEFLKLLEAANQRCSGDNSNDSCRFKRVAVSPITPKLAKPNSAPKKRLSTARKSLDIPQTEVAEQLDSVQAVHMPSPSPSCEHSYSLTPNTAEATEKSGFKLLKKHLLEQDDVCDESVISAILNIITSHSVLRKAVQSRFLNEINLECTSLSSRNVAFTSVLSRYRSIANLYQYGDTLMDEIIREMSERNPFLLDIFTTIATAGTEAREEKVAPIAAAYSLLMHARCDKLSAWHRLTTMVVIKGHTDDSAITRLNRMGLTMSVRTKLRLLDEAGALMDTAIVSKLKSNPLIKVTGDNLDIYIRTGHKSLDKSNTDLHLFASNAIFSRVAKPGLFSTAMVRRPLDTLSPDMFCLSGHYRQTMVNSYCVILGRILVELNEFSWMKSVLPVHIYHPYQVQMSQKSDVYQLPILMKNEAKHEDCVDILDGYETFISDLFVTAFGSEDNLHKFRVPVGGDQLTRVRLEEAKNLRTLATTPKKRFEDLHPFVIELWHTKQDYLEKCYKELYSTKTLRQPGTLYHYKAKLQRTDVNGKVKGAFKSHHDFIMLVGKRMVTEQFMEYFGMDNSSSVPTKNIPIVSKFISERRVQMHEILEKFMDHYGYLKDSCDLSESRDETDSVFNYSCNLCHWVVNLLNMDDIAKEGDIVRLVPSLMYSLQFFFSHSRLSKYFEECMDFILKCEYMLSPMDRIRVLEGAFTNLRGGIGCNIESDLVQENSVRNQKDLIRSLGANKTDKAILRSTKAADIVVDLCDKIDSSVSLKKTYSKHHTPRAVKDEELISKSLRELRPFNNTSGRTCQGLPNVLSSPLKKIDKTDMVYRMNQVIKRLYYGQTRNVDDEVDEDD